MRRNYKKDRENTYAGKQPTKESSVVRPTEILSAADMELENFLADGMLTKMIIMGLMLCTLASLALISASTQITLNRTRQDIKALSTQFNQHLEHNKDISATSKNIKTREYLDS